MGDLGGREPKNRNTGVEKSALSSLQVPFHIDERGFNHGRTEAGQFQFLKFSNQQVEAWKSSVPRYGRVKPFRMFLRKFKSV